MPFKRILCLAFNCLEKIGIRRELSVWGEGGVELFLKRPWRQERLNDVVHSFYCSSVILASEESSWGNLISRFVEVSLFYQGVLS